MRNVRIRAASSSRGISGAVSLTVGLSQKTRLYHTPLHDVAPTLFHADCDGAGARSRLPTESVLATRLVHYPAVHKLGLSLVQGLDLPHACLLLRCILVSASRFFTFKEDDSIVLAGIVLILKGDAAYKRRP